MTVEIVLRAALILAATTLTAATVLSLAGSKRWWVRMWDFPRVQIAVAALVVAGLAFFLSGPVRIGVMAVAAACALYQGWRIFPYTPLARVEMKLAPDAPDAVTLLSINVLMENRRFEDMRQMVARIDPDVVLFMETDQTWIDALEPVLARYPTVVRECRIDYYGMVFATRLEAREARIVHLTEDETPSLFAELIAPNGAHFRFIGLHPQPPVPGQDSDERDAQILYAALFARETSMPLVAMGDFNDVAWSHTAQRFKRVGPYLDPRVGRGFYSSFDANRPLVRFPLDQFYATDDVAVVFLHRGEHVGSDHFPMIARIRLEADLAAQLNTPSPEMSEIDRREIESRVDAHRLRLGDRAFAPGRRDNEPAPGRCEDDAIAAPRDGDAVPLEGPEA